ncbi:MAG: RecX family transcriptional regulator [Anaerolineales bacterium]|nr:RecX family transcriptional regulator [Anaerolineales bacterium]MDW8160489.1 RecX family transcriptional regulator [Anaerolineales bacterium]
MEGSVRTITALKVQKNRQRVNVFLDGRFAFGLLRSTAAQLRVGQRLTEEQVEQLLCEDRVDTLYQQALRYLSFRPRSEQEMHRYLSSRETEERVRAQVLERLRTNGWLDDRRFAEQWVENRSAFRPRSKKALRLELRQHGVQPAVVEQALQELDEEELAYLAVRKVLDRYRGLDRVTFQRRLQGFLVRRGFSYDIVPLVLHRCWQELHQNPGMEREEV